MADREGVSEVLKEPAATPQEPFDLTGQPVRPVVEARTEAEREGWWQTLLTEGQARKAAAARERSLTPGDIEALARQVHAEIETRAWEAGVRLPEGALTRLIGELSGLGPLLGLIARPEVEDIALNLGHIYVYSTSQGWAYQGPAPESAGDALRVLMDRAGQRTPSPDYPIADAMLQVMVPGENGAAVRKGVRVSYLMPPASPYGDAITLRVSSYRTAQDLEAGSLAALCQSRLPPVARPSFAPVDFPRGEGLLSPEAANYLLAVLVAGGTLVISGTTGAGKTYVAQRVLQEMLAHFPAGALRLFVVEDSNEIVLNGWDGDPQTDTGNVVYAVTRAQVRGGPPPVTMFDLLQAALRARPHGIIIGEARGAEAWELVRAAATGHGHAVFTVHATGAEQVWPRFLQVVQAHPDARQLTEYQIARDFAAAVTAIVHLERGPWEGQLIREIMEVAPLVERAAARPSFLPIFRYEPGKGLTATGNRPARPGFRALELNLPESFFNPVTR